MTGDGNRITYQMKPKESYIEIVWISTKNVRGKITQKYTFLVAKEKTKKKKATLPPRMKNISKESYGRERLSKRILGRYKALEIEEDKPLEKKFEIK